MDADPTIKCSSSRNWDVCHTTPFHIDIQTVLVRVSFTRRSLNWQLKNALNFWYSLFSLYGVPFLVWRYTTNQEKEGKRTNYQVVEWHTWCWRELTNRCAQSANSIKWYLLSASKCSCKLKPSSSNFIVNLLKYLYLEMLRKNERPPWRPLTACSPTGKGYSENIVRMVVINK